MNFRRLVFVGVVQLLCLSSIQMACAQGWQRIGNDVLLYEGKVNGVTSSIKLYYYLPAKRVGKIPCVFIAPAGSALHHGMNLVGDDQKEHLPYVKSGFAVVAYEIEGPLPNPAETINAAKAFMAAQGGVLDGKRAVSSALVTLKDIDPNRLYAAGHSSAGTTALALAAADPRIKACAAYAPCASLTKHFGADLQKLDGFVPGFRMFIRKFSPDSNTASLKCPVFLFNAADDDVVPPGDMQSYAARLKATNKSVKTMTVPTGGHHDSMINQGIPAGIQFFRSL